jgi:hypothetical protein
MHSQNVDETCSDFKVLLKRFHAAKHRCSDAVRGRQRKTYRGVKFGFESARAAARYCLEILGPLPSSFHTIDRIDPRRGYEPGNIRYATMAENLANRRFKSRFQFQLKVSSNGPSY